MSTAQEVFDGMTHRNFNEFLVLNHRHKGQPQSLRLLMIEYHDALQKQLGFSLVDVINLSPRVVGLDFIGKSASICHVVSNRFADVSVMAPGAQIKRNGVNLSESHRANIQVRDDLTSDLIHRAVFMCLSELFPSCLPSAILAASDSPKQTIQELLK